MRHPPRGAAPWRGAAPAAAFLAPLEPWERGEGVDPGLLTRRFRALLDCYLHRGAAHGGAFVTVPMEPGIGRGLEAVPWGLAVALVRPGAAPPPGAPELHPQALLAAPAATDPVALAKVRAAYAAAARRRRSRVGWPNRSTRRDPHPGASPPDR